MKKMLFAAGISVVLLGCTKTATIPPITNHIEIGTKAGAHSVVMLSFSNAKAMPEYQNYDVYLYLSQLPESKDFEICNFEYDSCGSQYSAWQNVLRPEQNGVWLSYDFKFPLSLTQEYDVNLATIQTIANQAFLEWDKAESLYTKDVSISGKTVQIESLTATAHQLP
ncbi:hypothetical protein AB4562_00765 [Vibrio sp. 10N.222.54.A1]|uniref:Uncharacterized protein n=2 Tax=Vibrio cyclitrophicus TaxID=47951 RepID=A0ACD5G5V1_9VIBR|nr:MULTISPECIES: hypothetical protein [Vibrio]